MTDLVTAALGRINLARGIPDARGYSNCPVCAEVLLPSSQRYEGACCPEHGAIVRLIGEVERYRAALRALADDEVDESDTRYWAQLVLDGNWSPEHGERVAG